MEDVPIEVFAWCMNCGAIPCLLHGIQEVVVRKSPREGPTFDESIDIVRSARLAEGRPVTLRYWDPDSQLPSNMSM